MENFENKKIEIEENVENKDIEEIPSVLIGEYMGKLKKVEILTD